MSDWTDTMSTFRSARKSTGLPSGLLNRLLAAIVAADDLVQLWQERMRQRRQLTRLNDRLLRDIGLSRIDAQREADKPFWRP